MSTLRQESTSALSPMTQSSCLDPLDIDNYLNLEQAYFPSPSGSSSSSSSSSSLSRGKTVASSETFLSNPNNTLLPQNNFQPTFSGPSHQYELFKQQTGIPSGALANTLAVNPPNSFALSGYQQDFGAPFGDGFALNGTDEIFDFNTFSSHNPSFSTSVDLDMFDSSTHDLLSLDTSTQSSNDDCVDPNAIGGQEEMSPLTTPVQSSVGRLWPGMHQQQAVAKAQAQQKQQLQQQQQRQQQQKAKQQPPVTAPTQTRQPAPRTAGSSNRPPTDPIVEERISRLLSQMRQNSENSSNNDTTTSNANGASHLSRSRKDEEDMDEDERLLASEEGKKLSSKERRQLRNKVSARAFRSRRKGTATYSPNFSVRSLILLLEYIGQLEGEIAGKVKESDDLRAENEALKAENTRLTDLTRMLLSSSAFSSFLNELSSSGVPNASTPAVTSSQTSAASQNQAKPSPPKDANPYQQTQNQLNNVTHVGMTMIPEDTMDFSVFDSTSNAWASNMDFGFTNAAVFSVMELPQGPAVDSIDTGILSGKSSNSVGFYSGEDAKDDAPVLEHMPVIEEKHSTPQNSGESTADAEFDDSDPAFALFADSPSTIKNPPQDEYQIFGEIELEKAVARLDLVVNDGSDEDGVVSSRTMARFESICASLDAASERISAVTLHL